MGSSVFNLGEVIGAFGSNHPRPVNRSNTVKDLIEYGLIPQYTAAGQANQGDLADYAAAIQAGTPQAKGLQDEDIGTISNLIKEYGSYDPTATYERLRSGNLSSLDNQFTNLVNYGSASDKARMAALGLGGRASSGSYGKILDSVRAARNLSPVLQTIYGNLGSDTSRITGDRYQNLMATLGLINNRAGTVDRTANRSLLPIQARNAVFQDQVNNLGGINNAIGQNTAGYESVPNGVARWGQAVGAVDKAANSALDTYLNLYSGGLMGGGGMGGGTGGGGGMTGFGGLMGGGGNTSGGNSNAQLMQLIALLNSNRQPQQYGGYAPLGDAGYNRYLMGEPMGAY
jgi:hypothetical protein